MKLYPAQYILLCLLHQHQPHVLSGEGQPVNTSEGSRHHKVTFQNTGHKDYLQSELSLQLSSVVKFHMDLFQLFQQNAHVLYAKDYIPNIKTPLRC